MINLDITLIGGYGDPPYRFLEETNVPSFRNPDCVGMSGIQKKQLPAGYPFDFAQGGEPVEPRIASSPRPV
ncbi:MAG: hypothetical protein GQ560_03180 [Dehalococcoidia bacterium]|nr:hypothetical protein [Dehalococcoidia bacterium]